MFFDNVLHDVDHKTKKYNCSMKTDMTALSLPISLNETLSNETSAFVCLPANKTHESEQVHLYPIKLL